MIPEENWIPISALQHYSYCPRQCALIHVEQVFEENLFTQRGRAVHRLVDTPESRNEHGVRVARALPLFSQGLGLTGKADVVEFEVAVRRIRWSTNTVIQDQQICN
jgi:CRISPR-associated exonuclease Cas4